MNVSIIGIDPGTRYLGIAVLEYNLRTFEVIGSRTRTILAERLPLNENIIDAHGHKFARLCAIKTELRNLFESIEPIAVYCEDNYYSIKTPSAYKPLIETVQIIRTVLNDYDPYLGLTTITASYIKAAIGAGGGSKKAPVMAAMLALASSFKFNDDLSKYDNNAVDALAIAVTGFKLAAGII